MKPEIKILDSVHCKVNKKARGLILPCLQYTDSTYRRGRFGGKTIETVSHMITGRKGTAGTLLTGLLPRVKKYCKKNKIDLKVTGKSNIERIRPEKKAKLKGIVFREDQNAVFKSLKKKQRGNVIATTGSGKTVVANGIFSMYPNNTILFLCHTKDLVNQTAESIREFLPERTFFCIGGSHKTSWKQIKKNRKNGVILISTIQSFSKISPSKYADFFDITIVDEVHHVNKKGSLYAKSLEANLSPIKIGLTATKPTKRKELLLNEGFFGPVLNELTMGEAIEKGINAKPVINLVPVPYNAHIASDCGSRYKKYYQLGIVENKERNGLIINEAIKSIEKKEIVLIIIEHQNHGKILKKMFKKKGYKIPFVFGDTDSGIREKVKNRLKKKKINCAICSRIWREGTNIPSLDHIIMAHGMKEEKIIIQAMGRGLRIFKNKTHIKLTDLLDPYKFLAEHSILRIQTYVNQKWM